MSTLTLVLLLYCTFVHPRVFDGVSVAHLFSFLCFVLCLVYLRPVSTVPDVASFFWIVHSAFRCSIVLRFIIA